MYSSNSYIKVIEKIVSCKKRINYLNVCLMSPILSMVWNNFTNEHIWLVADGVDERWLDIAVGKIRLIRRGTTAAEVMAAKNERNDMGRGGVEYSCIHKLRNKCSSWELNTFSVLLQDVAQCQINQRRVAALHLCHVCTYSCLKASTCSMVVIPARAKLSLYWLILMDSSHSGTDLNMVPSQPLVLGRRMDTLRGTTYTCISHYSPLRYEHWSHAITIMWASILNFLSNVHTVGRSLRWVLETLGFGAVCPKCWRCPRSEVVWRGPAASTGAWAGR